MSRESGGVERRKARRRPILNSFSLFVVVPSKGFHRLTIQDVSDLGMGFDLDTEGESPEDFPLASGESLELRFYLNQSLYLPLAVKVARVAQRAGVRQVGVEFADLNDRHYKAFQSFLAFLDSVLDSVRLDPQPPA